MIPGSVNGLLEPTVRLGIQDPQGTFILVEAVLDTGFNGDLALPSSTIQSLQLPFLMQHSVILADGNPHPVNVYRAVIDWDGQSKGIEVDTVEGLPLLGTRLLKGHDVEIEFVSGGAVRIRPRTP